MQRDLGRTATLTSGTNRDATP